MPTVPGSARRVAGLEDQIGRWSAQLRTITVPKWVPGSGRALISVIVAARHAAGLTQRQLAAKLKRSNAFVWKLEAGERQVNVLEFIEISRTLGVRASKLIAEIEG